MDSSKTTLGRQPDGTRMHSSLGEAVHSRGEMASRLSVIAGHRQERRPTVTPPAARAGEEVTVSMDRLPYAAVYIGFGALGGNHQLLTQAETDADGMLSATVSLPAWATADLKHFFFLAGFDQRPFVTSHEFHVADEEGVFRVEGEITDEGLACLTLRNSDDRLYTLEGETDGLAAGSRVVLRATLPEDPLCGEGVAIEVLDARVR